MIHSTQFFLGLYFLNENQKNIRQTPSNFEDESIDSNGTQNSDSNGTQSTDSNRMQSADSNGTQSTDSNGTLIFLGFFFFLVSLKPF